MHVFSDEASVRFATMVKNLTKPTGVSRRVCVHTFSSDFEFEADMAKTVIFGTAGKSFKNDITTDILLNIKDQQQTYLEKRDHTPNLIISSFHKWATLMRHLASHIIGIEQGSELLFSDFDNNGAMWAGEGERYCRVAVCFRKVFKTVPVVQVSLDMLDMDQATNQRIDISTDNVKAGGFEIVFKTWGDTKIARVRASWIAIGETEDCDQFNL